MDFTQNMNFKFILCFNPFPTGVLAGWGDEKTVKIRTILFLKRFSIYN